MNAYESITRDFFEAFRPPPKLTLSQWAEANAYLSPESSADPGKWRSIPYQKGIMDAITDPKIEQVSVMKSARVGYTKVLNNTIGYHIHHDPCPILVVQPTDQDAEDYSKEEIAPMMRDTAVLVGLVADAKAKQSTNTILHKMFPGGTLSLVGANSPRGFRRVSRRVILFDEVDGYPASAGTEGDPIKLGIKRSEYYWNRKIVSGSTPLVKDTSRIEKLFAESDQRRYFVPCPTCKETQYLKWGAKETYGIKWPDGEPERAYYVCEKNGCVIDHGSKRWMVENGEWRATATGNGKHAGFHIWAAYSYSPNATWAHLAAEWLEAVKDREMLKTFVNTTLGELWEEEYQAKIGAKALKDRVENYEPSVAPERVLALTCGVDVQDNRLSLSVYGWARGEEAWVIRREEIFGDPAKPEIWKQLDSVLTSPYRHAAGGELTIAATCVDSGGHYTNEVYQYVRERRRNRIVAIKGSSKRGMPVIGRPTKQDVNYKGGTVKFGVDLYPVGPDTAKDTIYARLKLTVPGIGYVHFHGGLTEDFFEQLTVEKKVTRYLKGFPVREYMKPDGKRNEALDEAVYAYAALHLLYQKHDRRKIWDQLEAKLRRSGVLVSTYEPAKPESVATTQPGSQNDTPSPEIPPSTDDTALKNQLAARKLALHRRPRGFVGSW